MKGYQWLKDNLVSILEKKERDGIRKILVDCVIEFKFTPHRTVALIELGRRLANHVNAPAAGMQYCALPSAAARNGKPITNISVGFLDNSGRNEATKSCCS
ncbi:MAG: hypothetical protein F4239_03340 [Gammaproteobacteria bacterium]|nr:hypothetical protein [Gammaproteobacteria bacterium]MYI88765.1 hypothetical protein [Gammaproteobacteria bacterium]